MLHRDMSTSNGHTASLCYIILTYRSCEILHWNANKYMQALTLQHEHHLCVRKDIFMEVLICAVLMVCSCSFNQMLISHYYLLLFGHDNVMMIFLKAANNLTRYSGTVYISSIQSTLRLQLSSVLPIILPINRMRGTFALFKFNSKYTKINN